MAGSWPTGVFNPNGMSIGAAVFAGLTSVTDWQRDRQTDWLTDHATRSVTIGRIYVHSTVMQPKNLKFFFFFEKDPLRENFQNSVLTVFIVTLIDVFCVQILWNLADMKSVKSCVAYLTKKQNRLHPKSARDSPRQCTQSAPDFIQIGSLSAELYRNACASSKRAVNCLQYSAEA